MPNSDYGLHARLGDLEVNFSAVNQRLTHTADILARMQDTMEQQTHLIAKVLVIQEKQESFKGGLAKVAEFSDEISKRLLAVEKEQTHIAGWVKGVIAVASIFIIVLSFSIRQNVSRLDKIEADYYKPVVTTVQK